MTHAYYRDAHGEPNTSDSEPQKLQYSNRTVCSFMFFVDSVSKALLLLYDITSKTSFDNIRVSLGCVYLLESYREHHCGLTSVDFN